MSAGDGYLEYPLRRLGMDHDRYEWSILFERPSFAWPGGAHLAVWVLVSLQWFRFDGGARPFRAMGAPSKEYPDYREWSHRDYGARVGVFRLMELLDRHGLRATMAIDAESCRRYGHVVEEAKRRGWELVAHGLSASEVLYEGIDEDAERRIVSDSLAAVREAAGRPVRGWLSPSLSESKRTPDLLAEHGIEYLCDWVNDDLPYPFQAGGGTIVSLPASLELNDVQVLWNLHHTAPELADQVVAAAELLFEESRDRGARTLCLVLHPWLSGQPHRIPHVERALAALSPRPGAWAATGSEIVNAFTAARGRSA